MTTLQPELVTTTVRLKLALRGAVQGVGFRPFVFRLATELRLPGWVYNSPQGVFIEIEGPREVLETFLLRVENEKPPRSSIQSLETSWLDAIGYEAFSIRESLTEGATTALIMPDVAMCPDCRREIFDPANRRYRYPFTNCTHCGPRFSIIEALPYDRGNTSMKSFLMCSACQAEYNDPHDRRFHAQPNACPVCGPRLEFWDVHGNVDHLRHDALLAAVQAIHRGRIVAVKGIGGFHLLVDARNDTAVRRLRERKHREEKPFALMFPSLETVNNVCEISALEERLLGSPEAPIVLLHRRPTSILHPQTPICRSVAPQNPNLGVMLPSNPLHYLLMAELGFPVVATSGNLSDEPICTDEREALERLGGIADSFLVHNRPIVRHMDDSIARVILGREMVFRRARGYVPLPINLRSDIQNPKPKTILAVGGQLKNSVTLAVGEQAFISQHIGDLETEQANTAFHRAAADLPRLYDARPEVIVADLHPDYRSTQYANDIGRTKRLLDQPAQQRAPTVLNVQHHVAHVLSCIAENEVELPALGVAWDGTGYGSDGTIWGGEFFLITEAHVERVAHLRPFRLPGGDAAVKEPRRAALGLLHEMFGEATCKRRDLPTVAAFKDAELRATQTMLERGVNAPFTSSVGRLFDAVASLTGLRQTMQFEGQAAMELEFALADISTDAAYDLPLIVRHSPIVLDWASLVEGILFDARNGVSPGEISAKFHNALVQAIVRVTTHVECPRVALSGGCFQNRYLTERAVNRLKDEGFQPYWHQRVPPNDGGISLGQVVAVRRTLHHSRLTAHTSR